MSYTTFKVEIDNAIAWVTFDYPPVNIQGLPMLADATSQTPALKRFAWADENGAQFERGWQEVVISVQEIQ